MEQFESARTAITELWSCYTQTVSPRWVLKEKTRGVLQSLSQRERLRLSQTLSLCASFANLERGVLLAQRRYTDCMIELSSELAALVHHLATEGE